MRRAYIMIAMCVCLAGCESAADVVNTKNYQKDGISFVYPGNWSVDTDEFTEEGVRTIFVESPGDAIVMIQQFDEPLTDINTYAETFTELFRQETPLVTISSSSYKPLSYTQKSSKRELQGVQERFSLELVGEHVPHVRAYLGLGEHYPKTVFICQVATEDLAKVRPGCDLIADHLKVP